MATIISFRPTGIRPNATSDNRRPDAAQRRKASSAHWWSPLLGWPSDPDYIADAPSAETQQQEAVGPDPEDRTRVRSRFAPGCFTEDKAKQLRKKTMETATFHDIMYHSAIASRLASDLPDRSSGM